MATSGGEFVATRVTAKLAEGITLRAPLMLDGLLAWVVCARERRLPPLPGETLEPVDIPLQLEPDGRFHLCTQGICEVEASELRHKNRRAPWQEYARFGSSKIKRVDVSAGANKSYRVPYSLDLLRDDEITWYCIGDPDGIRDLLCDVHYLGRHRGAGKGKLDIHRQPWRVEECESWGDGFPVVSAEGKPMRQLSLDYPGLIEPRQSFRTLTFPYYDKTREELCAIP